MIRFFMSIVSSFLLLSVACHCYHKYVNLEKHFDFHNVTVQAQRGIEWNHCRNFSKEAVFFVCKDFRILNYRDFYRQYGQKYFPRFIIPYQNENGSKLHVTRRRFYTIGRSSASRHYRLQRRGGGKDRLKKITNGPTKEIKLPARRCMLLKKMDNRKANFRSHSNKATKRIQRVNLHWKCVRWDEGRRVVRLRLSAKGIKTIKKYGIHLAAKKFGLDLSNKKYFSGNVN